MLSCVRSQAKSHMGLMSPRVNLRRGERFIAIRAFLDGSGKQKDSYVSLAAFAAHDLIWAEFERGWNEILTSGGLKAVPYFHMVEALNCRYKTPFCRTLGWTRAEGWKLAFKLIAHMNQFKNAQITMHSCGVDMDALRTLAAEGIRLPSEIDLCNRYVSEYIISVFAHTILKGTETGAIYLRWEDLLNFVFDQNEAFRQPFATYVRAEQAKGEAAGICNMWQLVDGIGDGDMRRNPGLQAADLLAWGVNRQSTAAEGTEGKEMAYIMRQLVMSTWKEYDEETLRKEFSSIPNRWYAH